MASTKVAYGTSTSITITATTLASASARESASIDNTSDLFIDAIVHIEATLAAGTPSNGIYVYVAGSEDGTNWGDNATGSDAALTMRSPTNLKLLGVILATTAGALTWKSQPLSVAAAFGGNMPRKWNIIVYNQTSLAFTAFSAKYTGVYYTTA